ncbi:GAF domain-containing protein [Pleurocapsales cyanobacterium LEGE 06147]|nr:GAF domain-containing protein [Pleurocapsales cyanobacterium LEGE 06147]
MKNQLPLVLEKTLAVSDRPDAVFNALLPVLGEVLQCDRCFLYLRDPETRMGRVPYCWRSSNRYPEIYDPDWKKEPDTLAKEDPLFAAALRTEDSIFVEDIETADPKIVNRDFEREQFGHRALIHAHICKDNLLWGILQPCIFARPRVWTDTDRAIVNRVVKRIAPMAIAYINAFGPNFDFSTKEKSNT